MKKRKAAIRKNYVSIEIRSSMYDKEESLYLERMMSKEHFANLITYICKFSEVKSKKSPSLLANKEGK